MSLVFQLWQAPCRSESNLLCVSGADMHDNVKTFPQILSTVQNVSSPVPLCVAKTRHPLNGVFQGQFLLPVPGPGCAIPICHRSPCPWDPNGIQQHYTVRIICMHNSKALDDRH